MSLSRLLLPCVQKPSQQYRFLLFLLRPDQAQQNHSVAEAKHGDADARAKEADRASTEISSRRGAGLLQPTIFPTLRPHEERYAQGAKDFVHKQAEWLH